MVGEGENVAKYDIQGIKLTLERLTINKVTKVMEFIAGLNVDVEKGLVVKDIVNILLNEKIKEFAFILFGKDANLIDWGLVEYELIDEMVEDFFLLNPRLKKRLSGLFNSLI